MSYPSTHFYETVYVLAPGTSEQNGEIINRKVDSVIAKFQGKLRLRDDWGIKDLAFPIGGHASGRYVIVNYSGQGGVVEEIERHFKISEEVLRYLTVCREESYDYQVIRKQIHLAEEEARNMREMKKDKLR